ncbi:MAG: type VI secretion system tip protein VgrG [Blastocatellia bacterium]|nr:type VI secretion system tip protein VgrG [Blastocatellia bacterium]
MTDELNPIPPTGETQPETETPEPADSTGQAGVLRPRFKGLRRNENETDDMAVDAPSGGAGGSGGGDGTPWTQNGRLIKVKTVLPNPNALIVRELQGHEAISTLFQYDLEMYSENPAIDLTEMINSPLTIRIRLHDDDEDHGKPHDRFVNGIVSEFAQEHTTPRFTHYRMTVRPRFWLMTQSTDCRIFQDMNVPDIVEQVLKDHGITDYEFKLERGKYKIRDYCVQYRESAYNFCARLLEEEGIFYYFTHEKTKHTLIFGDSPSHFEVCKDQAKAVYRQANTGGQAVWSPDSYDVVTDFIVEKQVRPTHYALRDFDFMEPQRKLEVHAVAAVPESSQAQQPTKREIYDYPGEYIGAPEPQREGAFDMMAEGNRNVKLMKEEDSDSPYQLAHGSSDCRPFVTGHTFTFSDHPRADFNTTYVIQSLQIKAFQSDSFNEPGSFYRNEFTVVKDTVPFRPQRVTPVPIVHGSQTAIVVGPAGEEIFTDKFGRIKVQFHWDRYGKQDEHSSCWLRVGTLWAGSSWGYIQIPRIGHEVIVDFLEGDPDRPYVVGSFYNGDNLPPYPLDSASTNSHQGNYKTVSTRKSRSTLHGTPKNYNEVRFEDLKDSEQLFIHAEKDMDTHVKHDSREHIMQDRHLIVDRDQVEEVQRNKHQHVLGNKTLEVSGRRDAIIGSIDSIDAGSEIHLKAGNKIVLEAGSSITLKVGGNFINVTSSDIYIKAPAGIVYIQDQGGPETGTPAVGGRKPDMADDGPYFTAKPR